LEGDCRYGEEIERDDHFAMVVQERQPTSFRITSAMDVAQIAGDSSFRDVESYLQQFAMDFGSTPTGVLLPDARQLRGSPGQSEAARDGCEISSASTSENRPGANPPRCRG
jgi:hypothetical protein